MFTVIILALELILGGVMLWESKSWGMFYMTSGLGLLLLGVYNTVIVSCHEKAEPE